jgi:hypothetical protein
MKRKFTLQYVVFALLAVALAVSVLLSLWSTYRTGQIYFLSSQFLADIPKRFTGPGRLRFILQPATAIFLGFRAGTADARAGHPPYIMALLFHSHRKVLMKEAFSQLSVLIAMSILADLISQFLILREMHTVPALLLGPVLIAIPYSLTRAFTNRIRRRHIRSETTL